MADENNGRPSLIKIIENAEDFIELSQNLPMYEV